jgi:hypothetical protein
VSGRLHRAGETGSTARQRDAGHLNDTRIAAMRRLRVPVLLKDRLVEAEKDFSPFEHRDVRLETLLPGPVSDRVAVVDLRDDGSLGTALPVPSGMYVPDPQTNDPYRDPVVIRWSAFAIVLKTLAMYEDDDCLGRTIPWAFQRAQLLLVPEAGRGANAFYHRESCCLQFFSFVDSEGNLAHAAASHDIVAHETGHAILDGIAPWLYDAQSPQSLAIHESIADLTALFSAASSRNLVEKAMQLTQGRLEHTWLFSSIARELGYGIGQENDLRTLTDPDPDNPETLAQYAGRRPHDLSVVLSRAFYALLLDVYDRRADAKRRARPVSIDMPVVDSDPYLALHFAVEVVKRVLFRGLDYLPPGDASFLDLARAVLACDRAAYPDDSTGLRALLEVRLLERGIGAGSGDLATPFDAVRAALAQVDLGAVRDSNWHAMRMVEQHRRVLGIPDGVPFDVLPRLHVHKKLRHQEGNGHDLRGELLLKVAWREQEAAAPDGRLPDRRWVRHGATVAFDLRTGEVCAWLRTGADLQREARDAWVAQLDGGHALAPQPGRSAAPRGPIAWSVTDDAYELHGTARALHLLPEGHP